MTRPLPTCERLREAFDYDSDTGKLTWRIKRANCAPGDAAGCPRDDGVLLVMLDYKLMKAHRLIWCWVFGEWPIEAIDHKDGDNQNNRIENLRDVSTETNAQNRRKSSGRTQRSPDKEARVMNDEASQSSHADAGPVQQPVGRPAPKRREDGMPSSRDERYLRRLLAVRVAMPHTYYDDGEAHGQEHGIVIDFMREPVDGIDAKLRALNVARVECAKPRPDALLRLAAEFTRADLGTSGTNYPHVRALLAFAERAIDSGQA